MYIYINYTLCTSTMQMHLSYLACFINSILRSAEISALCLQATVQVPCMCTWIQSQWCEWEPRVSWNLGARCVSNVKLWVIMHCLAVVHLVHLEADRLWEVKRESLGFHLIFIRNGLSICFRLCFICTCSRFEKVFVNGVSHMFMYTWSDWLC